LAVDLHVFIAIAEIAGIFVGFGALIGVTRPDQIARAQLARLRGLVIIGLTIIIAGLLPVALDLYGFTDHNLWFISSLIFYLLNWIVTIMSFRDPINRELMKTEVRTHPVISVVFWVSLEIPFHILLILILFGIFPPLEPALFLTALLIYLFQAAFALVQLVHSQTNSKYPNSDSMEQDAAPIIH
jgi:hypothetical protein